jgi:hypothetical protein
MNRLSASSREHRTVLLFGLALFEAFISYVVVLGSVHTYCENRLLVGALGFLAIVICALLVRNRSAVLWKKVLSDLGIIICMLTTAASIAFIWHATKLCRDMVGS